MGVEIGWGVVVCYFAGWLFCASLSGTPKFSLELLILLTVPIAWGTGFALCVFRPIAFYSFINYYYICIFGVVRWLLWRVLIINML